MEVATGFALRPAEVVVGVVVHSGRDLRVLGFEPVDRHAFHRPEVHFGELWHDDRLKSEACADDLRRHTGALQRARQEDIRVDLLRHPCGEKMRLLDAMRVERSIELSLEPAEDVALRTAVADQVEGGFAVSWVANTPMVGEGCCGWSR